MVQLLEGGRAQVQGPKGTLVARALVHDPGNDHTVGMVAVNDADTAAAERVAPGRGAHHVGGQGHDGLLVPVPVVIAGTIGMSELEEDSR